MILEMIYNVYDYQTKIFPWKVQNSFRVYFLEKLLSSSLCLSYIPFMFIQGFLSPRQIGFLKKFKQCGCYLLQPWLWPISKHKRGILNGLHFYQRDTPGKLQAPQEYESRSFEMVEYTLVLPVKDKSHCIKNQNDRIWEKGLKVVKIV